MMKKLNIKIWAGAMAIILLVSSCDDFLDINTNPNAATTADVQLVLPQAIVASASISSQFNSMGGSLWWVHGECWRIFRFWNSV
jgi:protein involved in sex pheromone biosynthesis